MFGKLGIDSSLIDIIADKIVNYPLNVKIIGIAFSRILLFLWQRNRIKICR